MGMSKTDNYSTKELNISSYAKALAHPARIAIIHYLLNKKECVCGDIVDELPIAQATVSQHLKELKKIELIKGMINGPKTCYCLNMDVWQKVEKEFTALFKAIEKHKIKCC
ncbi:MAG: ArsR/SmtB family transcription factor [Bacteroidia bacterium]